MANYRPPNIQSLTGSIIFNIYVDRKFLIIPKGAIDKWNNNGKAKSLYKIMQDKKQEKMENLELPYLFSTIKTHKAEAR